MEDASDLEWRCRLLSEAVVETTVPARRAVLLVDVGDCLSWSTVVICFGRVIDGANDTRDPLVGRAGYSYSGVIIRLLNGSGDRLGVTLERDISSTDAGDVRRSSVDSFRSSSTA
jgi:hypothetical protein